MSEQLKQSEFDDLSAWLDGELSPQRSAKVERLVQDEPAWARAAHELRALNEAMDGIDVPAASAGLAGRVLAAIPTRELSESETEQVSAYIDGELPAEAVEAVAGNLQEKPEWRLAMSDFREIDALLDRYTAPAAPADLAGRINAAVRQQRSHRRALRVASWLAPAAAAAVVLIGLAVFDRGTQQPTKPQTPVAMNNVSPELKVSAAFQAVPASERPALQDEIIRHLDFFQDYEVASDFETLEAIEKLDEQPQGI